VDVTREADLIEEVGRHWGLDRIPARFPALTEMPRPLAPAVSRGRAVRRLLCGAGLQEAVTFTFIEAAAAEPFLPVDDQVVITNPLSEKFAVLRPSLVPGLLASLEYNRNRQASTVRLFEAGSVFSKAGGERACVGWVLAGPRQVHWSERPASADFSDTKGTAELLATAVGATIDLAAADDRPWLAPGQRANLLAGGTLAGWIGRLAVGETGADPVFAGELDLDVLAGAGATRATTIAPLARFPSSVRDVSVLVDERLPADRVRGTIRTSAPATLVSIREFDRYQGKGVPDGQVSLSIRLTFQSADRTLLDVDVQQAVDAIVAALAREHHATLRGQ
jgi:phenylalanyl-tRNA synthetase beta chain